MIVKKLERTEVIKYLILFLSRYPDQDISILMLLDRVQKEGSSNDHENSLELVLEQQREGPQKL